MVKEMNEINDQQQQAASEDLSVVRLVDGASAFSEIWETYVALFGAPTSPMQSLYAKICRELAERGATGEDVLRRAGALTALWGNQCLTPTSLFKHWSRWEGSISAIDEADVERHRSDQRYRRLESGE